MTNITIMVKIIHLSWTNRKAEYLIMASVYDTVWGESINVYALNYLRKWIHGDVNMGTFLFLFSIFQIFYRENALLICLEEIFLKTNCF